MSVRHATDGHRHTHGHGNEPEAAHGHVHPRSSPPRRSPATLLRIGIGTRLAIAGGLIALIWLLVLLVLS